jgi:phosphatidylglycerophosphate synthase
VNGPSVSAPATDAAGRAPHPIPPERVIVKGRDCWWTVLVIDPIGGPLVRLVAGVAWVTPNLLTASSVVVAFGAAAAYAGGALIAGALLFQASFLLDCMDGKLAQARGLESQYGSYIDALGDAARFVSCTGALVFHLATSEHPSAAWIAALALFPTVHYAVLTTQRAWPNEAKDRPLAVAPTPIAFWRAARHRLSKPATTVDTEAIGFTVGPIAGFPLEALAAAAALDCLRLLLSAGARLRLVLRGSAAGTQRRAAKRSPAGRLS